MHPSCCSMAVASAHGPAPSFGRTGEAQDPIRDERVAGVRARSRRPRAAPALSVGSLNSSGQDSWIGRPQLNLSTAWLCRHGETFFVIPSAKRSTPPSLNWITQSSGLRYLAHTVCRVDTLCERPPNRTRAASAPARHPGSNGHPLGQDQPWRSIRPVGGMWVARLALGSR